MKTKHIIILVVIAAVAYWYFSTRPYEIIDGKKTYL